MAEKTRLLVVDDDKAMRDVLGSLFREEGYEVREASSTREALDLAGEGDFDVVLSDIRMPEKSGIALVGELQQLRPHTPVILMTAFGSMDSAVEALRAGAQDYITKPFESEAVLLTVERALERRAIEDENRRLRRAVDDTRNLDELVGRSPAMREIFALIRKLAHNRSHVLITGESGTGKEMVARAVHFHGVRCEKPFVPVNCTALPEGLLESELFGHVRGAVSGVPASKTGLFEAARGGTLFIDEIGDMSMGLQAKLLRVLQEREIRPVGSERSVAVDVRIIATSNKDLEQEVADGRFRGDLFYRMNVIPIRIPPLRERREDIPLLVEAFLRRHAGGSVRTFSAEAMERIRREPWRGNARELENLIERTLALTDSAEIGVSELPLGGDADAREDSVKALVRRLAQQRLALRDLEDRYLDEVLAITGGNKVQAAKILHVDRKTLYRRNLRNAAVKAAS